MLRSLKVNNFRCFQDHEFTFGSMNVAVGLNNAGKSTLAEALRMISIASSRVRNANFRDPPEWLPIPKSQAGCAISLQHLQINFDSLFHRYGDPPATITADFGDRGRLRLYVAGQTKTHCVVYDPDGRVLRTKDAVRSAGIPHLETMPQVGPVTAEETILTPDYVRGALSSRLAPLHFRNQLNLFYDLFPKFTQTVEETWPDLRVEELINQGQDVGKYLHLEIRDGDFVGEISTMGHGVQMWLQTIWFLTRAARADAIILDEPDVYMHADLQRKLIRYLRLRASQTIVTTHSTEIMSEVTPDEIVVIDKSNRRSARADTLPAVQKVLSTLGSAQNVHLARLWSARRFLLVEGDDIPLLHGFQNVLFPSSSTPIAAIPSTSFGGWGGWKYGLGASMALQNASGAQIMAYCLLDTDYHAPAQIEQVHREFARHTCQLHVWSRKEIENYLLRSSVIARALAERIPRRVDPPTEQEVQAKLEEIAQTLHDDCLDSTAQEFLASDRSLGASGANKAARVCIAQRTAEQGIIGCVSGKSVLHMIFRWVQEEFGVSLNALALIRCFKPDEVDCEMKSVLSAIELATPFPLK